MPNIIVDRRLFLTADKSRLVEADDPEAAFLWASEGGEVSEEDAAAVGYTDGTPKAEDAGTGSGVTVTKEADEPANKAVAGPDEDKAPAKPARRARKK